MAFGSSQRLAALRRATLDRASGLSNTAADYGMQAGQAVSQYGRDLESQRQFDELQKIREAREARAKAEFAEKEKKRLEELAMQAAAGKMAGMRLQGGPAAPPGMGGPGEEAAPPSPAEAPTEPQSEVDRVFDPKRSVLEGLDLEHIGVKAPAAAPAQVAAPPPSPAPAVGLQAPDLSVAASPINESDLDPTQWRQFFIGQGVDPGRAETLADNFVATERSVRVAEQAKAADAEIARRQKQFENSIAMVEARREQADTEIKNLSIKNTLGKWSEAESAGKVFAGMDTMVERAKESPSVEKELKAIALAKIGPKKGGYSDDDYARALEIAKTEIMLSAQNEGLEKIDNPKIVQQRMKDILKRKTYVAPKKTGGRRKGPGKEILGSELKTLLGRREAHTDLGLLRGMARRLIKDGTVDTGVLPERLQRSLGVVGERQLESDEFIRLMKGWSQTIRHEMYGSALTEYEIQEFQRTMLSEDLDNDSLMIAIENLFLKAEHRLQSYEDHIENFRKTPDTNWRTTKRGSTGVYGAAAKRGAAEPAHKTEMREYAKEGTGKKPPPPKNLSGDNAEAQSLLGDL